MNDMVKVEVFFECNGTKDRDMIEVPRATWDAMNGEERQEHMAPSVDVIISNNCSAGWNEL